MDATSALHHYVQIVFPVVGVLYQESLVLGIFVVAWGQIRHLMRNPSAARHGDFWRRIVILIAILLYVWMTVIAYSMIEAESKAEHSVDSLKFTIWTLFMVPIEVLSVLVVAGIFAAVALPEFRVKGESDSDRNLAVELAISFALACALHILYCIASTES